MKLKNIIPVCLAVLGLTVAGCSDDESPIYLQGVQVSSSYASIPVEGGSDTIVVKAQGDWTIEKVMTKKDSVKWLTISDTVGVAGEKAVVLSAPATLDGRTAELLLRSGSETQRINVIQGLPTVTSATCADVIGGPDSKTYQVTGTCTAIANTTYGNWYLEDGTGQIYIYGTLDAKGNKKNFASLGIEVGDEITVQGPKTTYGSVVELVDVTVVKINKSLIKVDSVENAEIPVEGGEAVAILTCKGQGVSVDIPEDAKSWLSISSIKSSGTSTVVKFKAAANAGGDRSTTIAFHTTDGSKDYSSQTTLSQKGSIVPATVAEFLAAPVGSALYRLSGVITSVKSDKYGNFYLKDFSGETYVYGLADFAAKGYKVGDVVTIVGKRAEYKGTAQMTDAVAEQHVSVTTTTITDVLTKADDANTYYMVSGEVVSIANPTYGNLTIKDGDKEIYIYGCYPTLGATGDARKGLVEKIGLKVGDKLSVIGVKATYKGTAQLSGCVYAGHTPAGK